MNDPVKPNQQTAPGERGKVNGTASVVVGCKLPNGLLMEVGKFGDPDYLQVRLNGSNANVVVGADNQPVVGGYGLTTVSTTVWDLWLNGDKERKLTAHKNLDFVRKGLVFAHNDMASARDHAKDNATVRNGFEPLNPDLVVKDPKTGEKLLEVDRNHFQQGQRDIAQARASR